MISNTCKYAIRAVTYLAMNEEEGKKIGIKEISKNLEIPSPFLGKILQVLAKQKMLKSTKGPHGGFSLGKEPQKISLLDIVEVVDGLDFFNECLIGIRVCDREPEHRKICPFHNIADPLKEEVYKLYKNTTIDSLAKGFNSNNITLI